VIRALLSFLAHHSLSQQIRKRFAEFYLVEIPQHTGVEAELKKMEDGVLNASDVLVYGQQLPYPFGVDGAFVIVRTGKAIEVP